MSAGLINLVDYTLLELALYGCGAVPWVAFYVLIIRSAHQRAYVGLPALGIWAYMSWELLWGFFFKTDMGELFSWGLKVYLPMSAYIGWLTLRHGAQQFSSATLRRSFPLAAFLTLAVFTGFFCVFIPTVDDAGGISSAHILNLFMSVSYLPFLMNLYKSEGARGLEKLPAVSGWLKLLGVCGTTAFCMVHLPERKWVHAIGLVCITLDLVYLGLYYRLKSGMTLRPSTGLQPGLVLRTHP
jgi:hypothetical protein